MSDPPSPILWVLTQGQVCLRMARMAVGAKVQASKLAPWTWARDPARQAYADGSWLPHSV